MSTEPRTDEALKFLRLWEPEGPWVLTCISTDRKGIETRTFRGEQAEELPAWIDRFNGERNLYFHVNPPIGDLSKKAERTDIAELRWLHVDIDPRAGEDLESERKRALQILNSPPDGIPEPTVVVFSGGGYQAFWRLAEPIAIDGDLERAEAAKLYNMELERVFGADNCHNIDRIMRLPGTINIPDKRKLKKGRGRMLARCVSFDQDKAYPISAFKAASLEALGQPEDTSITATNVPEGGAHRIAAVDDLGPNVADWCKVLIVQGSIPDDPKKYDSRSEALFAVVCELVRAQVDDAVIYGILTDPQFRISESVLEKGREARRYTLRQINNAKEQAIEPWLRRLNQRHAVIRNLAGKCVVIEEVWDPQLDREVISVQSFEDFRNSYLNQTVDAGDGKKMPVGQWWLKHRLRRQYSTMIFAPGVELEENYNLWKGFACRAEPGDCSMFLDHLKRNICSGDDGHYEYLIQWMARVVQQPGRPGETAVVLRGPRGTGKTFFGETFGSLFGRHFISVADPKFLVGSFNAHLRDCVVLFGEEAFYAGDKKHAAVLKAMITGRSLNIEAKYRNMETTSNNIHLIMASNEDWVVPAGDWERRFLVLDVGTENMQDSDFFGAVAEQMASGGREALLHHLCTIDLSGFQVRRVPVTEALQDQKQLSLDPFSEWIVLLAQEAKLPGRVDGVPDPVAYSNVRDASGRVVDGLYQHARTAVPRLRNESDARLGRVLRQWGAEPWSSGYQRGWKMPELAELRSAVEERFGMLDWHHKGRDTWEAIESCPDDEPF